MEPQRQPTHFEKEYTKLHKSCNERIQELESKYRVSHIITDEDVLKNPNYRGHVGDVLTKNPAIPDNPKEAFELFKNFYAVLHFEVQKTIFYEKYKSWNKAALQDGIIEIEKFIAAANNIPYGEAVKNPNSHNRQYQYVLLNNGFYDDYLMTYEQCNGNTTAAIVYGEYFLFYEYLKNELLKQQEFEMVEKSKGKRNIHVSIQEEKNPEKLTYDKQNLLTHWKIINSITLARYFDGESVKIPLFFNGNSNFIKQIKLDLTELQKISEVNEKAYQPWRLYSTIIETIHEANLEDFKVLFIEKFEEGRAFKGYKTYQKFAAYEAKSMSKTYSNVIDRFPILKQWVEFLTVEIPKMYSEYEPQQPGNLTKPNILSITPKPIFKAEEIEPLFKILKDFFGANEHDSLLELLRTGNDAILPLTFLNNGNQLADAFKQLKQSNFITGCQQKELELWIAKNFKYQYQKQTKEFTLRYLNDIISSNKEKCKNPILNVKMNNAPGTQVIKA